MKAYIKHVLTICLGGLLIAATQSGCKENTVIGSGSAPGINNILVLTDSFNVLSKTKYFDSVSTSNYLQYIYMGIGVMQDLAIGKTNMGLYVQLIPSSIGTDLTKYTIDSAFFILPYSGFTYGDTTDQGATKSFAIYQVTDPTFSISTVYYPSTRLSIGQFYKSGAANLSHLKDSVYVGTTSVAPHLRIRLENNNQLITDLNNANIASKDYNTFFTNFHGLYIEETDTTNPNGHAIPYFQLDGSSNYDQANVLIHYHDASNTTYTQSFYFTSQYCAHYNSISRTYNATANSYFQSTAPSDPTVILQNWPGAVIDVVIPGIKRLATTDPITHNVLQAPVINQAKLTLTINPTSSTYFPPSSTFPYRVADTNGRASLKGVSDIYPTGFIDGNINTSSNTYTLNIPRELQLALSNNSDTLHLRINGTTNFWGAYRAIIAGGNNSDPAKKMKFNVVYSKLK